MICEKCVWIIDDFHEECGECGNIFERNIFIYLSWRDNEIYKMKGNLIG